MGEFLVDALRLDQPGKGKDGIAGELIALSTDRKTAVRNYYIRKVSVLLAVLTGGLLLSVTGLVVFLAGSGEARMQVLERPGYGEGDRKEELTVQVEGEEAAQQMEITVQERKYTDEEKQQLLDEALEELEELLPGENASLDEVRSDLNFPVNMADGAVKVSWLTVPYGVIGEDGTIDGAEEEDGTLVWIQGTLSCSGTEAVYEAYARVFPPLLSQQEQFQKTLQKEVELADAEGSHGEVMELPEQVDGKILIWSRSSDNPFSALLALTLVMAVGVYLEMDSRVHERAQKRNNQLMLDYPDLMWKMTMLLGAGLSIKGVFSRISQEYLRQQEADAEAQQGKRSATGEMSGGRKGNANGKATGRRKRENIRYVYEEVTITCYEMQSGIPESQAYERFGKRCQLPEYIRLGSVLSQNLKKGSRGLTSLLGQEAETSLIDRKNHARKIGEQAGTKLLLPMILMLGIVLVILMVPAFLSF